MKRINVILMMVSALAFAACGLADPWKTWENEGELPSDRLLPSGLKETLCLADWWKFSYADEDFYFQFIDDGTVESNSTILRDAVSTTYYIDWDEPYAVKLTIVGGGHLGYLPSGEEEMFVVTSFDDAEIIASGSETGAEFRLVPATSSEVKAMMAEKADAVVKIEAAQRIVEAGMACGAIYDNGTLVGHYALDLSAYGSYSVRFDILSGRVLTHSSVGVTVDLGSTVALDSPVSVAGKSISSIAVNVQDRTVSLGNSLVPVVSDAGSWYLGSSYSTYIVKRNSEDSRCDACDAIAAELNANYDFYSEVELSDRTDRPFFTIPNSWDDNRGYVALYSLNTPYVSETEKDRVYFSGGTRQEMPYGGDTSRWVPWTLENYSALIGTYYNNDGVIIIKEPEASIIWLLSPVDGSWFKAAR